jgi:hypothetical protein
MVEYLTKASQGVNFCNGYIYPEVAFPEEKEVNLSK